MAAFDSDAIISEAELPLLTPEEGTRTKARRQFQAER
jgi:hypothetical protein